MMNLYENRLNEVWFSHEFYLSFYLDELQRISLLVDTVVIQVEINEFDLRDIKLFEE